MPAEFAERLGAIHPALPAAEESLGHDSASERRWVRLARPEDGKNARLVSTNTRTGSFVRSHHPGRHRAVEADSIAERDVLW
jgi:hypothetical protein